MSRFPALFSLMRQRHLRDDFIIVGYARDALTRDAFLKLVYRSIYNVAHPQADRLRFLSRISYKDGQFNDLSGFRDLKALVDTLELEQESSWRAINGGVTVAANFRHIRTFYMVTSLAYKPICLKCT